MATDYGLLNLNIARLNHQLDILRKQMTFCVEYPDHRKKLEESVSTVEEEISRLTKKQRATPPRVAL